MRVNSISKNCKNKSKCMAAQYQPKKPAAVAVAS
jgi:hypothetical protein